LGCFAANPIAEARDAIGVEMKAASPEKPAELALLDAAGVCPPLLLLPALPRCGVRVRHAEAFAACDVAWVAARLRSGGIAAMSLSDKSRSILLGVRLLESEVRATCQKKRRRNEDARLHRRRRTSSLVKTMFPLFL
jgi:hypothetical protein